MKHLLLHFDDEDFKFIKSEKGDEDRKWEYYLKRLVKFYKDNNKTKTRWKENGRSSK